MTPSRSKAGPASRDARGRVRQRRTRLRKPAVQDLAPADECVCSFGATRVGSMIDRVRLHVTTDRFLAGRRGDKIWEVACDFAALALTRLESRLRRATLREWITAPVRARRRSTARGAVGRVAGGAAGGAIGGRR